MGIHDQALLTWIQEVTPYVQKSLWHFDCRKNHFCLKQTALKVSLNQAKQYALPKRQQQLQQIMRVEQSFSVVNCQHQDMPVCIGTCDMVRVLCFL